MMDPQMDDITRRCSEALRDHQAGVAEKVHSIIVTADLDQIRLLGDPGNEPEKIYIKLDTLHKCLLEEARCSIRYFT
jgi:hypothetical protein